LIVATDYLTKWAEAATIRKNTKEVVTNFVYNQIVYRYGRPLEIVTDRGSHFVNELVTALLQRLSVKHRQASLHYPQANGLVKKTNGILTRIIEKIILENRRTWDEHIREALWAYWTAYKLSRGIPLFNWLMGSRQLFQLNTKYHLFGLQFVMDWVTVDL
jgi:transposase InsO family protein